jgi:hypothetical protein
MRYDRYIGPDNVIIIIILNSFIIIIVVVVVAISSTVMAVTPTVAVATVNYTRNVVISHTVIIMGKIEAFICSPTTVL